jgi:hypothetical protein
MRCLTLLLLCAIVAVASAGFGPLHREQRINEYLGSIIGDDSAALFAYAKPSGQIKTFAAGPITEENYLRVGSVTKVFTSHEWFKAQSHIGAALNTKPSSRGFSPSTYSGSDIITYRQLLSMTGGVHEYTFGIGYNETAGQFIPPVFSVPVNIDLGWKDVPLDFTPGSYFLYSNTECEIVGESVTRHVGVDVQELLKQRWATIAPSLHYDDGTLPDSVWPNTTGYLPWYYPPALPGVSGSLVGKPRDLLKAFRVIVDDPSIHYRRDWTDAPASALPGYQIGGEKYGLFWQKYSLHGNAEGHEGDLVVRSIIVHHRESDYNFFFHFAQPMDNPTLVQHLRKLIKLTLF